MQNANHALIQLLSGLWDRPQQVRACHCRFNTVAAPGNSVLCSAAVTTVLFISTMLQRTVTARCSDLLRCMLCHAGPCCAC